MFIEDGHSSRVSLSLLVNGVHYPLRQVCPGVVYLSKFSNAVPPGDALIVIGIDGEEKVLDVYLPDGISESNVKYSQRFLDDSVQLAAWGS
jgi:hypothetical protein